jgi:regulator of sirC expression with transglutaminase-like and TPR domain
VTPAAPLSHDAALIRLLDDPSPAVRRALLAHFSARPREALRLLTSLAQNPKSPLASIAQGYLDELELSDPAEDFRALIRARTYELETGALFLARVVEPDLKHAQINDVLDRWAERCTDLITEPSSAREKCRIINRVLFHEEQLRGNQDAYMDPDNSFLHRVLERRMGIPISLSTLYLLVAQRIGLDLEPVALPGHFVVGCYLDDTPFFIDAFEGGMLRSAEDIIARLRRERVDLSLADLVPATTAEVLCRMCRNLVVHFAHAGDRERSVLFAGFVAAFEQAAEDDPI